MVANKTKHYKKIDEEKCISNLLIKYHNFMLWLKDITKTLTKIQN
jgi:hypothetical protein